VRTSSIRKPLPSAAPPPCCWRSIRSELVRTRRGPAGGGYSLEQYENDRPYSASSFLSVAIAEVFGNALAGKSKERENLVTRPCGALTTGRGMPWRAMVVYGHTRGSRTGMAQSHNQH